MVPPDISVILPYYNAEATLEQATRSILNQSFLNFELLLINNNSTDRSPVIAQQLSAFDLRIKLYNELQQGVVFAANTGMKAAEGKYVARMDADDVAHPKKLENQFKHLESNPKISISATQVNYQTVDSNLNDFSHFVDWSNRLNIWKDIYENRFVEFPIVNPTLMIRKSALEGIGYLKEGHFPEDYEWFLRAIDKGHIIEKLAIPLLAWCDSQYRLTRTDSRYESDAFFQIKTKYLASHLKKKDQTEVWIWGAGKLGYQRSQLLIAYGIIIEGYIDIRKDKKLPQYPCVHFHEIDIATQPFILSYVSNRDRRDEVRTFLNKKGYAEGKNYIIAG